jgi:hypothetical protein
MEYIKPANIDADIWDAFSPQFKKIVGVAVDPCGREEDHPEVDPSIAGAPPQVPDSL